MSRVRSTVEAQKERAGTTKTCPRGWLDPVSLASQEPTSFISKKRDLTARVFRPNREPCLLKY